MRKLDATIYETKIDGSEYRLIVAQEVNNPQIQTWELFQIRVGYTEEGDAESGPLGLSEYIAGYDVLCYGMGGCTEDKVDDFIEHCLDLQTEEVTPEEIKEFDQDRRKEVARARRYH